MVGQPEVYDVFICHASEDKASVASPLAIELRSRGVRVWFDEAEILLGDSLRQKIDEGLARSRFGVVVLSHAFFAKQWTQRELDGLAEREVLGGRVVILPVLFDLTIEALAEHSPPLAGKRAAQWSEGVAVVADQIQRRLGDVPEASPADPGQGGQELLVTGDQPPSAARIAAERAKELFRANDAIGLHELMASTLRDARDAIGTWPYQGNRDDLVVLVDRIDGAIEVASALVATYAYWGDEETDQLWLPTMMEWTNHPPVGGTTVFISLLDYPSTRLMYAGGLAMVTKGRLLDAERLLRRTMKVTWSGNQGPLSSELHARRTLEGLVERTPADLTSEHVYRLLAPQLESLLMLSAQTVEASYELFELLLFLVSVDAREQGLDASNFSTGLIRTSGSVMNPRPRPVLDLEIASVAGQHPWIAAGLFEGDSERLARAIEQFNSYYASTHPGFFGIPTIT